MKNNTSNEKPEKTMKTHVLLINPQIGEASQNTKINRVINISFPTSIGILASYLTASGVVENVDIIDEQITPIYDETLKELLGAMSEPRIVGVSVLTLNCGRAYDMASKIKKIDPSCTVVFGGIHPTVVTDEVLAQDGVDVVVRGEGEETLKELVQLVMNGQDYAHIQGISIKRDGVIVNNPDRPLIQDLDTIPPFPYHLFEKNLDKYPNFSGVFGSRGCPYNCTFCSSRSISGKKYRYNSVERVVSEIAVLVRKYKQQSVHIMDDNISVNKKHFIELCDAIIAEGLHKETFFHGSMRGDNASDEILDKAKEANFKVIYYGMETGSERLMKIIDKGETVAQVVEAVKRAAEKGFAVGTTIIFGLPTETRKERWETMKKVRELPLASVRFNTLAPYPGTPVYNMLAPQGKILIKNNWENFGVQYMWESDDIPYVPDGNDRIELIFDTMWANFSYYVSLSGLKKLFTEKYAGGNVIKLSEKWYLNPAQVKKMYTLFMYLFLRFSNVTARMIWRGITR